MKSSPVIGELFDILSFYHIDGFQIRIGMELFLALLTPALYEDPSLLKDKLPNYRIALLPWELFYKYCQYCVFLKAPRYNRHDSSM